MWATDLPICPLDLILNWDKARNVTISESPSLTLRGSYQKLEISGGIGRDSSPTHSTALRSTPPSSIIHEPFTSALLTHSLTASSPTHYPHSLPPSNPLACLSIPSRQLRTIHTIPHPAIPTHRPPCLCFPSPTNTLTNNNSFFYLGVKGDTCFLYLILTSPKVFFVFVF